MDPLSLAYIALAALELALWGGKFVKEKLFDKPPAVVRVVEAAPAPALFFEVMARDTE